MINMRKSTDLEWTASKQTNKTIQLSMIRDEKKTKKVNETKQSY